MVFSVYSQIFDMFCYVFATVPVEQQSKNSESGINLMLLFFRSFNILESPLIFFC